MTAEQNSRSLPPSSGRLQRVKHHLKQRGRATVRGLKRMTMRDWMQFIIVPICAALLGLFGLLIATIITNRVSDAQYKSTQQQHQLETQKAEDQQRETTLQTYLDRMSDLILNDHLKTTTDGEIRNIARTRTLEALAQLDPDRKGEVMRFLSEANLIKAGSAIVDLKQADLSRANLQAIDLTNAELRGVSLVGANLQYAQMSAADLSDINLEQTDLSHANLQRANLSRANLNGARLQFAQMRAADLGGADLGQINQDYAHYSGANLSHAEGVTTEQLRRVKSLQGAIMPDGSRHP